MRHVEKRPIAAATSPAATMPVATSRPKVQLWESTRWARTRTINAGIGPVRAISFSPDNRFIAIVGESVVAWDVATQQIKKRLRKLDQP